MAAERTDELGRVGRRRERTRAALIDAAKRLFAEKGIDATTIAEIAEAADVGFGTFYNYFAGKDAALDAVVADAIARQDRLLAQLQGLSDPAALLAGGLRLTARTTLSDPIWASFVARVALSEERLWGPMTARLRRGIDLGVAAGRFHVVDVEGAQWAIVGAMLATMRIHLAGRLGENFDRALAAAALRILGVPAGEADAIAAAPLPALSDD